MFCYQSPQILKPLTLRSIKLSENLHSTSKSFGRRCFSEQGSSSAKHRTSIMVTRPEVLMWVRELHANHVICCWLSQTSVAIRSLDSLVHILATSQPESASKLTDLTCYTLAVQLFEQSCVVKSRHATSSYALGLSEPPNLSILI